MKTEQMKLSSLALMAMLSVSIVRSVLVTADASNPKETVAKAVDTLDEIKERFQERAETGTDIHETMGKGCDKETGNKVNRRQRINDKIADLTTMITKDTSELTTLKMEETKLEQELLELEQSLASASQQLTKLDEDFVAADAKHTASINAMSNALGSLEGKAVADDDEAAETLQKAAALLAAHFEVKIGNLGSRSALDVVIGTIKTIIDTMEKEQKEGKEKYTKTRQETAILVETLSKSSEDQAQHLTQCKTRIAEVEQRLETAKDERETLNTKVKGNEGILDEYTDFCGKMLKLKRRHDKRMTDAAQATGFAEAAVSNARFALLLSKRQRTFHSQFRHSKSDHWEDNSSVIPVPLLEVGRSLAHAAGLPASLGEGAAKMIALAGHALSNVQRSYLQNNMSAINAATLAPTKTLASPELLAAVDETQRVKSPSTPTLPFQRDYNSSRVLLLSKEKCLNNSHNHLTPAALAASWALENAAKELHSNAMKRVACEVRQRKPASANQLLVALARSLQSEDPEESPAGDIGNTSECEQKKLAVHSELREAENNAMNASADESAASTKLEGLKHELNHLSPYLPKLKSDQAGLDAGKGLFKFLHEEDAAEATEIEADIKSMLDDLQGDGVTGHESSLNSLLEFVKTLPAWAESDLKEAYRGVDEIGEKLAIRVSLVSGWINDLEAKIQKTEEELKEASSRKNETAEVLADIQNKSNFTCVQSEPESDSQEPTALFLHGTRRKQWIRKLELAAVNLASSLMR